MKKDFFLYLYELMKQYPDIFVVTGDLGYMGFDRIRDDFSDRFLNTGAAEVAMMDIGIGLALEGKIPIVYSITPFLLYRPFESLRTYINHEKIPVIMIGSGRDDNYKHDGFSHFAGDDAQFMWNLPNITSRWPENNEDMRKELLEAIINPKPTYINLVK